MHPSLEYTKTLHNSTLQLSAEIKKMMILNLHKQERTKSQQMNNLISQIPTSLPMDTQMDRHI